MEGRAAGCGHKTVSNPGYDGRSPRISEALRDALPQKMPFRLSIPVDGPGTGTPLKLARTSNVGAAAGGYAPYVGIAVMAYSAYKLNRCLMEVPK